MAGMAKHESRSVRELLAAAKHYSSLAVDLALYSLASGSRVAALEALRIESLVDKIVRDLVASASLAVRSPDQTGLAVAVDEIARGFDRVTDAAGDIAGLVMRGYPIHPYLKAAVNCCGDVVLLVKAERRLDRLPEIVDILLVKRGDAYLLAPEDTTIEAGDLVVLRGTPEEVAGAAARISGVERDPLLASRMAMEAARGGDELADRLIRLRWLSREMLDLALHSIVYGDSSVANFVMELEDTADALYHEVLELSYSASTPGSAREMAGIAVFAASLEHLADGSTMLANVVASGEAGEYLDFLGEALEEAEEGYVKIRATGRLEGKSIGELRLPDMGVTVLALGRGGRWIAPVRPDFRLRAGDVLLVKYYRPEGARSDREVLSRLEEMGFIVIED